MEQKERKAIFVEKANKKHNKYYSYEKVDYVNSQTKICIICPKHGEFWQTPSSHLRGDGCPKCANEKRGRYKKMGPDEFFRRAAETHKNKYDYSKSVYSGLNEKICIICPEHGEFWQTPLAHIYNKQGCPKCKHRGLNEIEMIGEFKKVHGDKYDYSKFVLGKMNEKSCIICPEHGEFWQTPTKHLSGQGCPTCAKESRRKKQMMNTEIFVEKAKIIHDGKNYNYDESVYTGTYEKVKIICPKHGEFYQVANYHLSGHGCPHCGNNISSAETEIASFIKSLGFEVELRNRTILPGSKEIDIFIPGKNLGIEYDGLVWHSDRFKDKNYHLEKTEECAASGVRLIHIFEDEWCNKKDIVKSMLINVLGVTERKIFARKCNVVEIDYKTAGDFIGSNHIQGKTASKVNLALVYESEIVSVMTFGKPRLSLGHKENKYDYELIRFCSKLNTSVIGAAGKLFSYFLKTYKPMSIISYCDRRWSIGNMYEKIGFKFDHASQPNYFYVEGSNRKNRFRYRKAKLVKMGYDKDKSEREITSSLGLQRIYDCGSFVYIWKKEGC